MTRQQFITLIIVNALVAALISFAVVFIAFSFRTPSALDQPVAEAIRTPAIQPSPTRRTSAISYIVRQGDTLSSIAVQFNISTAALMQANGITNPNVLAVGQSIIIPPLELTPVPVGAFVATAVPILRITAIVRASSAQSAVGELLIIQNLGARVNLKGWTLTDIHGNLYAFPDFVLESNAGVRVHTDAGLDTATDLFWGHTTPVWDNNDTATLKNRDGVVMDSYTIKK